MRIFTPFVFKIMRLPWQAAPQQSATTPFTAYDTTAKSNLNEVYVLVYDSRRPLGLAPDTNLQNFVGSVRNSLDAHIRDDRSLYNTLVHMKSPRFGLPLYEIVGCVIAVHFTWNAETYQ